ncbi:MAG: hypothetical protein PHS49_02475 [Candidatus Gracilibacteria bacterium]|nr:hypothetical protein [Candidatus Gracilibacteria bacterium]
MKKIILISLITIISSFLFGCNNNETSISKMTEAEAKAIAEKICIKGGESISPGYYNENTKTWWFDANLNATKPGCNPACVVSETTKTAEINWRCTGLIVPENNSLDELTSVFKEKYPKYSETLKVIIKMEAENLVRGDIILETGAPGGIFFATKIDGKWKIVHEGNGAISCSLKEYGFSDDMLYDCVNEYNYQDLMDYIDKNITEILGDYPEQKPANGKWFADGYGFTSINDVYVDFEDGHFMYRALLNCNNTDGEFSCSPSAIFEKEKDWKLVKGVDTVKDFPIIYSKAVDYEWKR